MAITRSIINSLGGEGKWLFWFCEGWLVWRAKPNVPFVRMAKIELKKSAVGKK